MWRLFNKLFGWQYVVLHDCNHTTIHRVEKLPNGYWMGNVVCRKFFIKPDGSIEGGYLPHRFWPLTDKIGCEK